MQARSLLLPPSRGAAHGTQSRLCSEGGKMSGHVTGAQVKERLTLVHERVEEALERSGRGGEQVRVLVATKYYDWEQLEELAKRAPETGTDILIQVNIADEESKYGVSEDEIEALLDAAAATGGSVRASGFMTLPPLVEDPEGVRYVFAKLRTIRDSLRKSWSPHFDLSELSMGMSGDYEVAVEEGATVIRIGRMLIEEDGPVRRQDGS